MVQLVRNRSGDLYNTIVVPTADVVDIGGPRASRHWRTSVGCFCLSATGRRALYSGSSNSNLRPPRVNQQSEATDITPDRDTVTIFSHCTHKQKITTIMFFFWEFYRLGAAQCAQHIERCDHFRVYHGVSYTRPLRSHWHMHRKTGRSCVKQPYRVE